MTGMVSSTFEASGWAATTGSESAGIAPIMSANESAPKSENLAVLFNLKRFDHAIDEGIHLSFDITAALIVENYSTDLVNR